MLKKSLSKDLTRFLSPFSSFFSWDFVSLQFCVIISVCVGYLISKAGYDFLSHNCLLSPVGLTCGNYGPGQPHVLDRWCVDLFQGGSMLSIWGWIFCVICWIISGWLVSEMAKFCGLQAHCSRYSTLRKGMADRQESEPLQMPETVFSRGRKKVFGHRWWNSIIRGFGGRNGLRSWVTMLVTLCLTPRGEALNPGPSQSDLRKWTLGAFNPSGLGGKQQVISTYLSHADIWAVSETHLTSQGFNAFRNGFRWSKSPFQYCVGGAPVPLRAHSNNTGSWQGVAVISKHPTRAIPVRWAEQVYESSRAQVVTSFCADMWISGAVIYGEPTGAQHPNAKQNTDLIALDALSNLLQVSGLKYYAGDFNYEPGGLEVFDALEAAGFRDIQDLALDRWGQKISRTCKGKTRKDFIYISRELQRFLAEVQVDPTIWADHAVLTATFHGAPSMLRSFHWRTPRPLNWPDDFVVQFPPEFEATSVDGQYTELWSCIENSADVHLRSTQQPGIPKECKGRGATLDTVVTQTPFHRGPVRPGRVTDVQPVFSGICQKHAHWFRQLRRIQSYVRHLKANQHPATGFAANVWHSVVHAKGFPGGFCQWWFDQASKTFGAPAVLPLAPPEHLVASKIYDSFLIDVRTLEQSLKSQRKSHAIAQRKELAHLIFKDIRRKAPDKIDLLIRTNPGAVTSVCTINNVLEVDMKYPLDSSEPIFIGGSQISVLQIQGKQVWVVDVHSIAIGDAVSQTAFTGDTQELFSAFAKEWERRWDRHKNVPASQWYEICQFGRKVISPVSFDLPDFTPAILRNTLRAKKKSSASGLDGVSLADLCSMPDEVLSAHCRIYERAESEGTWPSQTITGKVASLAKTENPEMVQQYRPITVFSQCYRPWGGLRAKMLLNTMHRHCPSFLFGNRPHCQASQVWMHLAWTIEQSFATHVAVGGIIADIEKAFNHLPREVIFQCAIAYGVPMKILTGWAAAVGAMTRRFEIRGSLCPPLGSSTGFPEGDAMSCFGMMLLDCLFHKWFESMYPLCQPISYVDDLQLITREPREIPAMLEELATFARLVDLTVDSKKTFVWCNGASYRAAFKRHGLVCKHQARGLGAQLQFGRRHSTAVLRARFEDLLPLWPRLRQSLSPYKVKVLALKQAAWSRCLHGVAVTSIALDHFSQLRSHAMRGLGADGAGCNAWIQLRLLEHPMADPLCWAIVSTIRIVRENASPEMLSALLHEALQPESTLPTHSVTRVLVDRLHFLGWSIDDCGIVYDRYGSFSLLRISFIEIVQRVSWAWQDCVCAQVSHRKTFEGLQDCDPSATRAYLNTLTVGDRGLMRKALNGAHFTNDAMCYFTENGSTSCEYCGGTDSRFHRFWECEVFKHHRQSCPTEIREHIEQLPLSLTCHGWRLRPKTWWAWKKTLLEIPDAQIRLLGFRGNKNSWIDIFTDGSCLWPRDKHLRLASWAIVLAHPTGEVSRSEVVGAGPVSGFYQTAYRAELLAVLKAIEFAIAHEFQLRVWSDCQSVVTKLTAFCITGECHKVNSPHGDLWELIEDALERFGAANIKITKVAAHQDVCTTNSAFEQWAYLHNGVADHAARLANLQRDASFWTLHRDHAAAVGCAETISQEVQKVILDISKQVVAHEQFVNGSEPLPERLSKRHEPIMDAPTPPWQHFEICPVNPCASTERYGYKYVATLGAWFDEGIRKAVDSHESVRWISIHQLFLDFQMQTGCLGLIYKGRWIDPEKQPGWKLTPFPFKKRSTWFSKTLKTITADRGVVLPGMVTRPSSQWLALHVHCVAVPWESWRLEAIEHWLSVHLPGGLAATRAGVELNGLPPAKQDGRWPLIHVTVGPIES